MDIKWIYLLLVLCLGFVTSEDPSITCQSQSYCRVKNQVIEVRNGAEIKLYFNISDRDENSFAKIRLKYNNTELLIAHRYTGKGRKVVKKGMDDDIWMRFTDASFTGDAKYSVLQFTFTNLSMEKDNGNKFEYVLVLEDDSVEKVSWDLNVRGGPTQCGLIKLKESYNVEEGGNDSINLTLCGNPSPNVTANIGNKLYKDVKKMKTDEYEYMYSVSLVDITPGECGHDMNIAVVGDSTSSLDTKINVLFTPAKVKNIYAFLHQNNCMIVTWNKVEAGNCEVTYEIIHNKTNEVRNLALKLLTKEICNASSTDTVSVRGLVNERPGEFGEAVTPSTSPRPDPTNRPTSTIPDKEKQTQEEEKMEWKYILAIVVGTIALVLITAVIVIAVRRKDKSSTNNNDNGQVEMLRPNQDQEGDYADVNTLSTLIRPPVNKSSLDDQQMVYAELGPGGGRLGPKHIPEESNYAQVRTEGVHYPELQQSSYRNQPHSFSVATRTKSNESSTRPPDKDDYDDYEEEDVIV